MSAAWLKKRVISFMMHILRITITTVLITCIFLPVHILTQSYQGIVPEPGVGLTAGRAACVGWSYSATAVSPVCHRTERGHTPACHA